ncbi:uncharacterized protein K452DRAFT_282711 [Aplosporella prunicola CBS 121167]|uniref:glucan endo-1,3-beta-D-glucosidase n=1 Tax=Aplosporella prunicola CBS 121167 TaxID=1176127 RepID=A0A6A6BUQ7_9PEZI|nr:uncharacterized protein K452DRAFT_282711 [Aplosporella prunicola CBS 121167]KAF2146537.1 hypothetical protein K452DRAFT_282711 [Aplosporella prunicola CBS 121167]
MRYNLIAGSALALASGVTALSNGCADAAPDESGNYYCEPAVKTLKYTGVGGTGSYKKVTNIAADDVCEWADHNYSGSLAPYDEEIAVIFRGPFKLRQFAAYTYDGSADSSKAKAKREEPRSVRPSPHERRHAGHQQFHNHQKEVRAAQEKAEAEKRDVEDWITATIDGAVVSWVNNWTGQTSAANAASSALGDAGVKVEVAAVTTSAAAAAEQTAAPSTSATATATSSSDDSTATGPWKRVSYYNAEEKTKEGLTFLTHPEYTNTIAFAGTDGVSKASESTTFGGELENGDEMFIMTDSPCSEDIGTECAYFKDGDQAFHGFGGNKKAFFFEFQMPDSGTHATVGEMADKYTADNMPAIWTLNSKILSNQYGCSCWESGCGELDMLEVLNPGNSRMKSTFHGNTGFNGGDSHYISRPFDYYMSVMAVFHEDTFVIKVLNNGTEAPDSLTQAYVDEITGHSTNAVENVLGEIAVFAMSLFN